MKMVHLTSGAKKILLGAALLGLASCASLPHVFGGSEVPEGALNAPRLVEQPAPESEASSTWQRLGDVPSKPNDFPTDTSVNQSFGAMETDRAEAAALRRESGVAAAPQKPSTSSQPMGF